jgi:hypothetical protein
LCFSGGLQGLIGCHHRRGIVMPFLPLTYLISMIKLVPRLITDQSTSHGKWEFLARNPRNRRLFSRYHEVQLTVLHWLLIGNIWV